MSEQNKPAEPEEAFLERCFANALSPKLKLFLSADIVGSTQFKQPLNARSKSAGDWSRYIKQFYDRMDYGLIGHWKAALDHLEANCGTGSDPDKLKETYAGDRPCRWKTVGDEILFWKVLGHEHQIWLTLDAWLKTVRDVRLWFKQEKTGLDVKCTAWVAGFPVRNRAIVGKEIEDALLEIRGLDKAEMDRAAGLWNQPQYPHLKSTAFIEKFYREADWNAPIDFIGPGIDRGFRIQSFATTARMPISLDLAYLMAVSVLPEQGKWPSTRDGLGHDIVDAPETRKLVEGRVGIGGQEPQLLYEGATAKASAITNGLGVHYAGEALLKGVIGGAPYPNLWLDTHVPGSLDRRKDELGGIREPICWQTLYGFCRSFLDDRSDFMFAPFIDQDDRDARDRTTRTVKPEPDNFAFKEALAAYRASMISPISIPSEGSA